MDAPKPRPDYTLAWKQRLTSEERTWYAEEFVTNTRHYFLSVEPAYDFGGDAASIAEISDAFRDPAARFLLMRIEGKLAAAVTTYDRGDYVQVRHAAISPSAAGGSELARKLFMSVIVEYPGRPLYGIARKGSSAVEFYKTTIGADIGKYFIPREHPDKKADDGWVGITIGTLPSEWLCVQGK